MLERIREIVRKELIQSLREPRMRFMLFLPPLIQLLIFGFAVNLDLEHSKIAWMDLDNTPESRDLGAPHVLGLAFEARIGRTQLLELFLERLPIQL